MKTNFTWIHPVALWASVIGILAFITEAGFAHSASTQGVINYFYLFTLFLGDLSLGVRYRHNFRRLKRKVFVFDLLTVLFTFFSVVAFLVSRASPAAHPILSRSFWIHTAVALVFIREISEVRVNYRSRRTKRRSPTPSAWMPRLNSPSRACP